MGVGLLRLPMEVVMTLEKYWDGTTRKHVWWKKHVWEKTQQNNWVGSLQKGAIICWWVTSCHFQGNCHMALYEALKFPLFQPWIQHDPTNGQETENSQECQNRSKDLPMEHPIQMSHKNWNICLYINIICINMCTYIYIYIFFGGA